MAFLAKQGAAGAADTRTAQACKPAVDGPVPGDSPTAAAGGDSGGGVSLPSLSRKKLEKLKEKYEKKGVVYISRIPPHLVRGNRSWDAASTCVLRAMICMLLPPHMLLHTLPILHALQKPQKLRQLLEEHGEVGRLYLAPEDPALRRKRKQQGGNSGKNFTEGWVEFEDKAQAKQVRGIERAAASSKPGQRGRGGIPRHCFRC
jgi:hypothetical protein